MIPQRIKNLIKTIVEKTDKGEITWGKTSRENEFKLFMENGAITTDNWEFEGEDYIDMSIYNNFGDKIENFSPDKGSEEFSIIKELHQSAKREFFKVEKTIDGMFMELQSSNKIGKREVEEGDEELPW